MCDVFREAGGVGVNRPRQSEVENLHMAVVSHHHVCRLQIAVDDVLPMRRRQRAGQRNRNVEKAHLRQSAVRNYLVERGPLDELHRYERNGIVFLDGEDGDDVRVVQRSDGLGLASEAREPVCVPRDGIRKSLQRHITIQFRVARAVDLTHATSAEQGKNLVGAERRPIRDGGASSTITFAACQPLRPVAGVLEAAAPSVKWIRHLRSLLDEGAPTRRRYCQDRKGGATSKSATANPSAPNARAIEASNTRANTRDDDDWLHGIRLRAGYIVIDEV